MKLGIPIGEEEGLSSRVDEHFGRAPRYALIDMETGGMTTFRATRSLGSDYLSNYCVSADQLMAKGVNAVACRNMGRNTQDRLTASGIKVFKTDRRTVGEVVKQYRAHHLESIEPNDPSHVAADYLFED